MGTITSRSMGIVEENHNGKTILIANFSECKTPEELIGLAEKLADMVIDSSGDLRVLSNYEGVFLNPEFMKKVKELSGVAKGKVNRSAVVGVGGVKRILLNGYNAATGRNMKAFDDRATAISYLAKD